MADRKFAGITGAGSVIGSFAKGTEFEDSTSDPNLNDGFEKVTPKDFGGDGGISTGLPTDLQGKGGFNLPNSAAQNIITDLNGVGVSDDGGLGFKSFDSSGYPSDPYQKVSLKKFPTDNDMDGI